MKLCSSDNHYTTASEPANFYASDQLGRNFPTAQNGLEKSKNLDLTKLV